jgi:hypothetical protein
MNSIQKHSSAWVNFVYASFFTSVLMTGIGIFYVESNLWAKGYLAMGTLMIVMMAITLTKTIRDNQDANRIEDLKYGHGQN